MRGLIVVFTVLPLFIFGQSLAPPVLSHESGFYTDEFHLKFSHPDTTAKLLYTTDGSVPTIENRKGKAWTYKKSYPTFPDDDFGALIQDTIRTYSYSGPIRIKNREGEPDHYADISSSIYINDRYHDAAKPDSVDVFKGVPVRAVTYKNGEYSEVVTRNYFISPKHDSRYTLPVICLTVEPDAFFDYEKGWNVPGKKFDTWRKMNPSREPGLWSPANYRARGKESELEINFTYLVNGEEQLNHGAGLRANGNSSRIYPNRSLRLYAKSGYGPKNFEYPFFADYSLQKFKRLILRNSGQDTEETMFRDALIQRAAKNLNCDIQEYQPVILFINGEYWGLYNLRERYDKKYFDRKHGVDEDELDFIKSSEVKEGDDTDYLALRNFMKNNSLADPNHYQRTTEWMDIENVIDYYIVEIFAGNVDWPQSNTEYWRKRVPFNPSAPYGHDGRWRMVLKDLDYSMGKRWGGYSYKGKDLERVTTLSSTDTILNKATLIFRSLLENESFREQFITRFLDVLNSSLRTDVLLTEAIDINQMLKPEMEEFISRWSPTNKDLAPWFPVSSYKTWTKRSGEVLEFIEERPNIVRGHIKKRFDTGPLHKITLDVSNPEAGYIQINTLHIQAGTDGVRHSQPYPWTGRYFENVPVTATVNTRDGYAFSHWSDHLGNLVDSAQTITLDLKSNQNITAVFHDSLPGADLPDGEWVSLYPNPFEGKVFINMDQDVGWYYFFSIDGKLVKEGKANTPWINTYNLPAGVYFLRIESGDKVAVKKIVKM